MSFPVVSCTFVPPAQSPSIYQMLINIETPNRSRRFGVSLAAIRRIVHNVSGYRLRLPQLLHDEGHLPGREAPQSPSVEASMQLLPQHRVQLDPPPKFLPCCMRCQMRKVALCQFCAPILPHTKNLFAVYVVHIPLRFVESMMPQR